MSLFSAQTEAINRYQDRTATAKHSMAKKRGWICGECRYGRYHLVKEAK